MVNENNQQQADGVDAVKQKSSQVDALQNQLGGILSGVEKSLAVTCESIMGKMKQLEDKIQDMEKRYTELAKDAEQTLKDVDKIEPASEGETKTTTTAAATTETTQGENASDEKDQQQQSWINKLK